MLCKLHALLPLLTLLDRFINRFMIGVVFIAFLEVIMIAFGHDAIDPMQAVERFPGMHEQQLEQIMVQMAAQDDGKKSL